MEKALNRKPALKGALNWIIQIFGTFLFVFFMMADIVIFTTGMKSAYWAMPLLVIPSCIVCITFGADYWIGNDKVRLWSYCISNIIAALLLVPTALSLMTYSVTMMPLRIIATILLPIIPILYGIGKVKKQSIAQVFLPNKKMAEGNRNKTKRMKVISVICLISINGVLFENWYKAILFLYGWFLEPRMGILLPALFPIPLSILSSILLAKFAKAEFVQQSSCQDKVTL